MPLQNDLLLQLTNEARACAGVAPLRPDALLGEIAQLHAETMAREGYFDHIDRHGRGIGGRLLAAHYNYRWCGENISAGKAQVEAVMQWWLSSDAHRENLLKAEFSETGWGYCYIANDRNAFHHYWVQVFATRLPG